MSSITNKKPRQPEKESEKHFKVSSSQEKNTYFDQEKFLDDLRGVGVRVSARKPV